MQVFMFHLMPYQYLDLNYTDRYAAAWVVLPNSEFDPEKGHELYNRYLDEMELAERAGFDGLCVNEHHQTAYGLMPSPIVMASALARRTTRAKIAVLGSAFLLREHPLTLAEEHAMIDVITGGRLITGMVRGVGAEYFSFGSNPTQSHERFHEAHDLVVQAWTRPGPFSFEGKHFHFEYVNVWPRPYQQPHPPIWCPSQGSSETIEWSSHPSRRYVYVQTYSPFPAVVRAMNLYRESARRYGYEASSEQLAWATPIYVAETDERAVAEAAPHIEAFFNKFLAKPFEMVMPPGYLTPRSFKSVMAGKANMSGQKRTIQALMDQGIFICGSPETVRRKLTECHAQTGFQNFIAFAHFGTMPHDLTVKNIELLARHVIPHLKRLGDDNFHGLAAAAQ